MELAHSPTLVASPPTGERLPAGTPAGDYVIERFIGAGAMGEVYAGRHPVIGKRVAIKVLRRELATEADAADRFVREAQAAGQVEHPNVVDVFGFGRLDDGRLYLVMDLIDGEPLRSRIKGPLPVDDALAILATIADALDAAHARGVVHRDLKPDNIVMAGSTPKILDFGLAKLVSATAPNTVGTLTGRGSWVGTPAYMAPEQWSAEGAGAASDRYALGVIAFELLAGMLPFAATNLPRLMEQHFRAPVPPLARDRGRFDAVLKKALAKEPEARFPTGRAMVDALRAAAATAGKRTARPWLAALAGAIVLGGGIIVVVLARGGGGDRDEPEPAPPSVAPAGRFVVESDPAGARIYRDDREVGITPAQIDAGDIVLRKPGYLEARANIHGATRVTLVSSDRYQGVWRLPSGELRALEHQGDAVVVSKLDAVNGPRTYFRRYAFVETDGDAIAFATSEDIVDPHKPDDPSCHANAKVEYRFRPATEQLEQRRQRVAFDFVADHCVVREIAPGDPQRLVRVDHVASDPTWIDAPGTDTNGLDVKAPRKPAKTTKKSTPQTSSNANKPPSSRLPSPKQDANPPPPQQQAAPQVQDQLQKGLENQQAQ